VFLILESRPDTHYGDVKEGYEFPARYLRHFQGVSNTNPIVVIIYEPVRGGGSRSYVGWTSISSPPKKISDAAAGKQAMYFVQYDKPIEYFEREVFRLQAGIPLESWLASVPKTSWGLKLQGRAVRPITVADATNILALGNADLAKQIEHYDSAEESEAKRGTKLLQVAERSATFRRHVVSNFAQRCAVTGLSIKSVSGRHVPRLLHAAHIRSVAGGGSDQTHNGISLTPTLHALFDEGMFTFVPGDSTSLVIRTSPHLSPEMVRSKEGADLLLSDGRGLAAYPLTPLSRSALEYHLNKVFQE
jgi:hypothetical protein